jgi:hypothetical protein
VPDCINHGGERDERRRFGISGPCPLKDRGAKIGTGQVTDDTASSRSPRNFVGVIESIGKATLIDSRLEECMRNDYRLLVDWSRESRELSKRAEISGQPGTVQTVQSRGFPGVG